MWLDDKTVQNLKNISKKLMSPAESLALTRDELGVVQNLRHDTILPDHILLHFFANGLSPDWKNWRD